MIASTLEKVADLLDIKEANLLKILVCRSPAEILGGINEHIAELAQIGKPPPLAVRRAAVRP